jgi:hypothetical protein
MNGRRRPLVYRGSEFARINRADHAGGPLLADVIESDGDAMFSNIGDTESVVRERGDARGVVGQVIEFVDDGVSTDAERVTR